MPVADIASSMGSVGFLPALIRARWEEVEAGVWGGDAGVLRQNEQTKCPFI